MTDSVLHSFLKLRGLIPDTDKKTKEIKSKNKEYVIQQENKMNSSMINKIIEEKPKEKYVIKYFQERLKELDEQIENED
jgi:hypothetical protein